VVDGSGHEAAAVRLGRAELVERQGSEAYRFRQASRGNQVSASPTKSLQQTRVARFARHSSPLSSKPLGGH
jgi:hypothetical protein